jgi:hypothetical protein
MRCLLMVTASQELVAMGQDHEDLVKAGVLLSGEGLQPRGATHE